jgi:hypothetical protein
MTTIVKFLSNKYVLGTLLLSGAILDAVLVGHANDLSKSDWGTWVGSIGTVATLAGTIWLATEGERKQTRNSRVLARLHSASMLLRLVHAQAAVVNAYTTLSVAVETPIELGPDHLRDMLHRFSSINVWQVSDVVPLIALPDNTAVKLAQVADHLVTVRQLLENTIRHYPGLSHEERTDFAITCYIMLSKTRRFLDESLAVCNGAVTPH